MTLIFDKIKKFNFKKLFLFVPIIIVLISLILYPQKYMKSALNGLIVFANNVFPALFPFIFFSSILTALGFADSVSNIFSKPFAKIYKMPPISSYIFAMSLISGYPIGAKLLSDAYENNLASQDDVKRIMTISSMSGPIFIVGTIGSSILGCPKYGYIIWISHIVGTMLNGLIYSRKSKHQNGDFTLFSPLNSNFTLENHILSSIKSILIVGGYIVIFYILADVFYDIGVLKLLALFIGKILRLDSDISTGISLSLVEMTKGIIKIGKNSNIKLIIPLITGIITFGGLNIAIQSMTYLEKAKIKVSYYLTTKLTQSILASITAYIILLII